MRRTSEIQTKLDQIEEAYNHEQNNDENLRLFGFMQALLWVLAEETAAQEPSQGKAK